LDAHPKVGSFHINLLGFYNKVVSEGGYDKVSDTKGNKLAWRRVCEEFLPRGANPITLAFLLKTCYYKNLA
jgi:chromatin structure-remodeling complex subunit RSC9